MKNVNWQYMINAAVALVGLYVVVAAAKMKISGKVSAFVASGEELLHCKDEPGLAKAVSLKMMGFGMGMLCFGILNIANEILWKNVMLKIVALGAFMLICGLFLICLRKAREAYLS